MNVASFGFRLPDRLIAQQPSYPRDACRLMALDRRRDLIQHKRFYELPHFLQSGDVLVFNNSKVLPARIRFKVGDKEVELLLTRKIDHDHWLAIGSPGKMLKADAQFFITKNFMAQVIEVRPDGQRLVRFSYAGEKLEDLLSQIGCAPFPPYLKNSKASFEDYQTVYAQRDGSVAAPTAGLHFTKGLLNRLSQKGVQLEFVTLHVGPGTFFPVKTRYVEEHRMHSELYFIDAATARRLKKAKQQGRRLLAVGTTAVRVLEESYDKKRGFKAGFGETSIYIYPGYSWQCVDGLITNFHLPKSTLLLLTCAFGGTDFILKAYDKAMRRQYRFYSFGDAMLIQ